MAMEDKINMSFPAPCEKARMSQLVQGTLCTSCQLISVLLARFPGHQAVQSAQDCENRPRETACTCRTGEEKNSAALRKKLLKNDRDRINRKF